jgi:hypothetical protein
MKKTKIINLFLILSIVSIGFWSCKKDNNNEQTKQQDEQKDLAVYKKIKAFDNKLKLKEGDSTTMSLDSAIWYMEASLNVNYGRPDLVYTKMHTDTIYLPIQYNENGSINFNQISQVYDQILNDYQNAVCNPANPYHYLVLSDIEHGVLKSGNQIAIYQTYGVSTGGSGNGSNGVPNTPPYPPFSQGEDWLYGNMKGKCDGTMQWISDAGEELEKKYINKSMAYSSNIKIINVESPTAWYDEYPTTNNPYGQYKLYMHLYPTQCVPCVSSNELNYYLSTAPTILFGYNNAPPDQRGERPVGKDLFFADVFSKETHQSDGQWRYEHYYSLKYGVFIIVPDPD